MPNFRLCGPAIHVRLSTNCHVLSVRLLPKSNVSGMVTGVLR